MGKSIIDHRLIEVCLSHYVSLNNVRARQLFLSVLMDILTLDELVLFMDKCIAFHKSKAG